MEAVQKYDVYGMVRSGQAGSSSQKYVGSLGHESDTNTGLIYMRARYMDPVLGRFLSEDPSKDGGNWFVYCGDEPINLVDTSGRAPENFRDALQSGIIAMIIATVLGFFTALGYYLSSYYMTGSSFYDCHGYTALFGDKGALLILEASTFILAFAGEWDGNNILSNLGSLEKFSHAISLTSKVGLAIGAAWGFAESYRQGMALFWIFLIDHPDA
jgi:RHS repeat-associated protein